MSTETTTKTPQGLLPGAFSNLRRRSVRSAGARILQATARDLVHAELALLALVARATGGSSAATSEATLGVPTQLSLDLAHINSPVSILGGIRQSQHGLRVQFGLYRNRAPFCKSGSLRTGRGCVRVRRADQEEHGQSHGNRACSDDPRWDVASHASPYQTLCGSSSLRGSGRLLE